MISTTVYPLQMSLVCNDVLCILNDLILGLFKNAIAESGSMLADWAVDRNSSKHGYVIAELAGCPLEPYADLLHCLRSIDVRTLRDAQLYFSVLTYLSS